MAKMSGGMGKWGTEKLTKILFKSSEQIWLPFFSKRTFNLIPSPKIPPSRDKHKREQKRNRKHTRTHTNTPSEKSMSDFVRKESISGACDIETVVRWVNVLLCLFQFSLNVWIRFEIVCAGKYISVTHLIEWARCERVYVCYATNEKERTRNGGVKVYPHTMHTHMDTISLWNLNQINTIKFMEINWCSNIWIICW